MPDYPTITSDADPSQPLEEPPEDYSAPVNPSDIDLASGTEWSPGFATSTISAPVQPEAVELQRQRDFLAQPAPTDEEAGYLYERLPFLSDEEKPGALAQLNRYAVERENTEAQTRYDERQRELLDPEARLEWLDQDEVKNNLGYLADSNAAYDRQVVRKYLENDVLKRSLTDAEYEAARNDMIGRGMAGKPKISDQEAFGVLAKRADWAKKSEEVLDGIAPEILRGVVEANVTGKPFRLGDVWDKTRKGIPDLTPEQENELYALTARKAEDIKGRFFRNAPGISTAFTFWQKLGAGTATDEDQKVLFDELRKVPQEDLEQVLLTAAAATRAGEIDPGILKKAVTKYRNEALGWHGLGGALKGMTNTGADGIIAQARKAVEDGTVRLSKTGQYIWTPTFTQREMVLGGPLTEEEKADALQKLDELEDINRIDRTLRSVYDTKVKNVDIFSPTTAYGIPAFAERAFFGAKQQLGPMVLMGLSAPAYFAVIGSQSYEATVLANPKMDKGVAARMAGAEAAINFIGDSFQIGKAKSWFQGLFKNIPAGRKIARGVALFGVETATELGQDYFSDVAKRFTQEAMSQLNPNIDVGTKKKWEDMMSWDQVGETAGQMFFLAGIGIGALTYRDVMDPKRSVYNDDMLRRAGIPQDKIDAILSEEDFDERDRMLQRAVDTLTPAQKNNGILYSQEQDAKVKQEIAVAGVETPENPERPFVPPRLVAVDMKDGTRRFNLLDGSGTIIQEGMTEEVASAEWADAYAQARNEWRQGLVDEEHEVEQAARTAKAEAEWRVLPAEERTTAANVLEFSHVQPTPEQQRQTLELRKALKGTLAEGDDPVIVSVDNPATRAGLGAVNFINWFEGTFGKRVVFVASESGKPLSFGGLVGSADPNTIFLDASGDRNILSLLGHEWSHTLEATNPKLWGEVVERMKPLVVDWAKQVGKINAKYKPEQATPEFVANVIGDAFSDPDFWRTVRERHSGLFERLVQAIKEWFDTIIDHASEWGTQAPDVIKDLQGMRNLIAEAIERAREGAEEVAQPTEAQVAASRQQIQFANRRTEKGFYSKLEAVVADKVPKVASPEQVKATINGAGIKAEEIKWSGVMPTIDKLATENAGKVPKEKLVTHLEDEGSVKFQEVELGSTKKRSEYFAAQDRIDERIRELNQEIADASGGEITVRDLVTGYKSPNDLTDAGRKLWEERLATVAERDRFAEEFDRIKGQDEPRYATYVLPGGENYREVVLAMPPEKPRPTAAQAYDALVGKLDQKYGEAWEREMLTENEGAELTRLWQRSQTPWQAERDIEEPPTGYTSSHFPNIPNYVAHMRLNEREGGLFIEEIQSDRHQAGREKGYVEPEVRKRQQKLLDKPTLTDAEVAEIEELSKAKPGEIPDAPFRSDWHMAMFKRALRDAVATGQRWIGWTTGGTQYDRWGSEKFDWERLPDDTTIPHKFGTPEEQAAAHRRLKEATDAVVNTSPISPEYPRVTEEHTRAQQAMTDLVPGWGRPEHHAVSWRLSAQEQFQGEAGGVNMEEEARQRGLLLEEKGTRVVSFEDVLGVVGRVSRDKDKAQGMAEKLWKKMQEKDSGTSLPRKEGMEYFYDTAMPSAVGKYVKQWGGKVEQATIAKDEMPKRDRYTERWYFPSDETQQTYATWKEAVASKQTTPIWKVEITPQMKVGVSEGQAQFAVPREEKAPRERPKRTDGMVEINTFDRDAKTFAPVPTKPTKELLKRLKVEAKVYAQLLECLNAT